jgi:hypothetical protein
LLDTYTETTDTSKSRKGAARTNKWHWRCPNCSAHGGLCLAHREIAQRYARQNKKRRERNGQAKPRFNIAVLRVEELDRFYGDRYGGRAYVLPDDDAGRDDADVMRCHFAGCPDASKEIVLQWLAAHAPWMTPAEADQLLQRPILKWRADKLAWRIGLTYAVRQRLDIRTIGAIDKPKAKRAADARARRALGQ